jgi:hypothetical protein
MNSTLTDLSMFAFALLNGLRVFGYLPQIIRIHRDPHGAAAVSILTWATFAAANGSTVWYVLATSGDRLVAAMFGLNMAACLTIAVLTAFKRGSVRLPPTRPPANLSQAARVCTPVPQPSKG